MQTCLNEEMKLKTAVQVWPHGRCSGLPRFQDQFCPQDDETDHPLKSLTKKYINKQVKKIYFNINSTLTLNTHQLNTLNTH